MNRRRRPKTRAHSSKAEKNRSDSHTASGALVLGVVLFAFLIRLVALDEGLWSDEGSSLAVVFAPDFLGALRSYDHGPVYFVLLKAWALLGEAEWFLRLPSLFFGLLTVFLVTIWGFIYSRWAGALAGLLVATQPAMIRYSHEIRDYGLLVALSTAAFYAADVLRTRPDSRRAWWVMGLALVAASATHAVGAVVASTIGMLLLPVFWRDGRREACKWLVLVLFAAALSYLATFHWFIVVTKEASSWWMPQPDWGVLQFVGKAVFQANSLREILKSVGLPELVLPVLVILPLLCAGKSVATPSRLPLFPTLACLLLLGQLYVISWTYLPVFWYRTVLPAVPVGLIAFARLAEVSQDKRLRMVARASVLCLIALQAATWVERHPGRPWEPWHLIAARYMGDLDPNDVIITQSRGSEYVIRYTFEHPEENIRVFPSIDAQTIRSQVSTLEKGRVLHILLRTADKKRKKEFSRLATDVSAGGDGPSLAMGRWSGHVGYFRLAPRSDSWGAKTP